MVIHLSNIDSWINKWYSNYKEHKVQENGINSTLICCTTSVDEYVAFFNDYRPHHHLNGQTPNNFESKYIIKNGLVAQQCDKSNFALEIKKTFSSGQLIQKGSKVLL